MQRYGHLELGCAFAGLLAAQGMLAVSFLLPKIRLDATLAIWLYWLTSSASLPGTAMIAAAFMALMVCHAPFRRRRMLHDILVHMAVLGLVLGGGAALNEYLIKPAVAAPRPNIVELARQGTLGMTAEMFYSDLDAQQRRQYLDQLLSKTSPSQSISLAGVVRGHWIRESGYSMPSGHAFAAMLLATYFVVLHRRPSTRRRNVLVYLLPPWAILVAWSRVLLGVHRPVDVVCGGALGLLAGIVAALIAVRLLAVRTPRDASTG